MHDGPERALALRYESACDAAPRLVARGEGPVAQAILELAREHHVPVREDPDLVQLLAACELGSEIPGELFDVVARLLVQLYRTNEELAARRIHSAGAGGAQHS